MTDNMADRVEGAADELPTVRSDAGTTHVWNDATGATVCGHVEAADLGDDPRESDDPAPPSDAIRMVPRREIGNVVDCSTCYKVQAKAESDALGVDLDDLAEGLVVRFWTTKPVSKPTATRSTGTIRSLPPWTQSFGDHAVEYTDKVEVVDDHGGLTFSQAIPVDYILEILDE